MPKIQPRFKKQLNDEEAKPGEGEPEEEEPKSRCCCGWRCCCGFLFIMGACPFAYSHYSAAGLAKGQLCFAGSQNKGAPLCCQAPAAGSKQANMITPIGVPCGSRMAWLMSPNGQTAGDIVGKAMKTKWEFPVACSACGNGKPMPPAICGKSFTKKAGNMTCGQRVIAAIQPPKVGYAKMMMSMMSKKKSKKTVDVLTAGKKVASQFPACKACASTHLSASGCECDYRPEFGGACVKPPDGLPWCYVKPGCKTAFPGARGDISVTPCLASQCFCDPSQGVQGSCSTSGTGPKKMWCYVADGCPYTKKSSMGVGSYSTVPCGGNGPQFVSKIALGFNATGPKISEEVA